MKQLTLPLVAWIVLVVILLVSYIFASQLAHPAGWIGRTWMPQLLNNGNKALLDAALRALDAKPGESIADIGFGGGYAIDQLRPLVKPAKPIGVEVSETMMEVAVDRWDDHVDTYLATVTAMPLRTESLDGVLTVNTIYFWKDPALALQEIRRVLKPGGRLVIAFRKGPALRLSPVSWFRFRLYSAAKVSALLVKAGFDPRDEAVTIGSAVIVAKAV